MNEHEALANLREALASKEYENDVFTVHQIRILIGDKKTSPLTDKQIEYMITRFLCWKLPEDFNPDAGISFKKEYNENTSWGPNIHEPEGTNLFDYDQAKEMILHMLEGLPE